MDTRTERYAAALAAMIRRETVSVRGMADDGRFRDFQALLAELFPHLFAVCERRSFAGGFVLRWPGRDASRLPVLFMNHHDVVEASEGWKHPPFSGEIAEGRLWGRGTLDDKGGLWAMLQAADELAAEGWTPGRDLWFSSSCTEETSGEGAREIAGWFQEQGLRFEMCFDEGGMMLREPIGGVHGAFAMVGVGEKGCADLRFIARSRGGHASMPGRDSPLVRLGKFMAAAERSRLFPAELSPTVCEMFRRFAPYMGRLGGVMKRPERFAPLLRRVIPSLSGAAAALVRTTLAFTMAQGSGGTNVLPSEAWVVGNMRYSHHQGREASFRAVEKLAKAYDVEMEIIDPGAPSRVTDYRGRAFRLTEQAVRAIFPDVIPAPYIMTGASDSRFFDPVCDQSIRFLPFFIDKQQFGSIHGVDENVSLASLIPAVDWYQTLMREV